MNSEMNKTASLFLAIAGSCFLPSCDTATPETYFDRAVLNSNLMHGFAGRGLQRELEQPSVKLADNNSGATVPMKRKEIIDNQITSLEANLVKIRKLKETEDSRDILAASIALYEYVLPVYGNEYQQLAELYDEGAAREQIESLTVAIETKYGPRFKALYDQLAVAGKPYAARHNIKVKWDVATEPPP
jgi:hypothetical protein